MKPTLEVVETWRVPMMIRILSRRDPDSGIDLYDVYLESQLHDEGVDPWTANKLKKFLDAVEIPYECNE